jgi:hypothetical protein
MLKIFAVPIKPSKLKIKPSKLTMHQNTPQPQLNELQLNFIKIGIDTQSWQTENQALDIHELSHKEFLTECAYGNIEIFEDITNQKNIALQNIELGALLLDLDFVLQNIISNQNTEGQVMSLHQNFALYVRLDNPEEIIIIANYMLEPHAQITLRFTIASFEKEFSICKKYYYQMLKEYYPKSLVISGAKLLEQAFWGIA